MCARRNAFRKALWTYHRYRQLQLGGRSRVLWQRGWFVRPIENYVTDFEALARRFLSPIEYRVFTRHILQALPQRTAMAGIGLNKGEFWHCVYRIETAMGAACVAHRLYPLWRYLNLDLATTQACPAPPRTSAKPARRTIRSQPRASAKQSCKGIVKQALADFGSRQQKREERRRKKSASRRTSLAAAA